MFKKIDIIKNLLRQNLSIDEIAEYTQTSKQDLQKNYPNLYQCISFGKPIIINTPSPDLDYNKRR